ncbi:MAG: hypothetical protein HC945_03250 [Nitrosarchaeum sp.]|nr:hypothetical protein [Nitrosarchaeum sp.]
MEPKDAEKLDILSRIPQRRLSEIEKEFISLKMQQGLLKREKARLVLEKGVFVYIGALALAYLPKNPPPSPTPQSTSSSSAASLFSSQPSYPTHASPGAKRKTSTKSLTPWSANELPRRIAHRRQRTPPVRQTHPRHGGG